MAIFPKIKKIFPSAFFSKKVKHSMSVWLKKIKAFLFFCFLVSLFCLYIIGSFFRFQEKQQIDLLSQEVRQKLKPYLVALPPPPFKKNLGHMPSKQSVALGRMLFNDPVLSRNNDVSCATCHLTNHGFADGNRLNFGALGKGGPTGNNVGDRWAEGELSLHRFCGEDSSGFFCDDPMFRNSLSTLNVIYRGNSHTDSGLLWDGRFGRLAFQVLLPIHTREEMCGVNPMPSQNNLFKKGGVFFDKPVTVKHSHTYLPSTGKQISSFNSPPQTVYGVESFRDTGSVVYPSRNECLAIAVAKIRKIPSYQKKFKKIYNKEVSDLLIGRALADFVSTHIANKSPYDHFVAGKNTLSLKQLKGMAIFMTPAGQHTTLSNQKIKGANCAHCHSPPFFGGSRFYSLGVKGDERSSLSRPGLVSQKGGFAFNVRSSHGRRLPACHIVGVSVSVNSASPDIGRAIATSDEKDCFKFRVPVLRNAIETYPYFHHGTETGLSLKGDRPLLFLSKKYYFKELSLYALRRAIEYHLRGPVDVARVNSLSLSKVFFDPFFQLDSLVPGVLLNFGASIKHYPISLSEEELDALVDFVAFGLFDEKAVQIGYLGNRLNHPAFVPSGFTPSITRDKGTQSELPPSF